MMWRTACVFVAVLAVVVVIFSVRSITRALRGPEQAETVTAPELEQQHTLPPLPSQTTELRAPPIPPGQPETTYDYSKEIKLIRQREEVQKETIRTLRRHAEENPGAQDTLSKEEIDKLEKAEALIE